jgi:hypothetical protein
MTPAGVGQILPGDSKTAFIRNFSRTNFPDLLANQAHGARESLTKASQAHNFRPTFYK